MCCSNNKSHSENVIGYKRANVELYLSLFGHGAKGFGNARGNDCHDRVVRAERLHFMSGSGSRANNKHGVLVEVDEQGIQSGHFDYR